MADFDPIKALREELSGLTELHRRIQMNAAHKEAEVDQATTERDDLLKTAAFLKEMIARMQARLRALEDERDRKAQEQQQ